MRETQVERGDASGWTCPGVRAGRDLAGRGGDPGGPVRHHPGGGAAFADGLGPADEVALEATGNTWAIATLLASRAGGWWCPTRRRPGRSPRRRSRPTRSTRRSWRSCWPRTTCRRCGARPATAALRRQVLRRAHIVRQRTRLKNQVQAILHRNLIPRCPAADLFGTKGRAWLAEQQLPADELAAATALLRELDFHAEELRLIDAELGRVALGRPEVLRLMSVPGVDATVALSIVAGVGDFARFRSPKKLVGYLGLNPRVRQSGGRQPATGGSPRPARGMPAACWSKRPGPPPRRPARCGRSTRGSARGAGCKSRPSRPRANSRCCAGI